MLHILLTPEHQRFHRDAGLELADYECSPQCTHKGHWSCLHRMCAHKSHLKHTFDLIHLKRWMELIQSKKCRHASKKSFKCDKGGRHLKNFGFFEFIFISSNCCCTHLLASSKVLDLLDVPFQIYDGVCPCIDLKIQRETTRNTNDER